MVHSRSRPKRREKEAAIVGATDMRGKIAAVGGKGGLWEDALDGAVTGLLWTGEKPKRGRACLATL
jgi:hypothetical protein